MIQGDAFVVKVQTNPVGPVYTTVADMNKFSKSSERDSNTYAVFARALKYVVNTSRVQTFDISGYLVPGDAGQTALFTAESANSTAVLQVLFDGTNGFTQSVYVNSFSYDVDPESPQEIGWTCTAAAAAVIVGTGPVM